MEMKLQMRNSPKIDKMNKQERQAVLRSVIMPIVDFTFKLAKLDLLKNRLGQGLVWEFTDKTRLDATKNR